MSRPQTLVTSSGRDRPVPLAIMLHVYERDGQALIGVRVSPSARKTSLKGAYGDRIKVAVSAPPVDGRANDELEEALAAWTGVPRSTVEVTTGRTSRDKVVAFKGLSEAQLRVLVAPLLKDE